MRKINKIVIHCTATPEGREHDVADIRRWRLKRGFNDIGYHFLVHIDGTVEYGRPIKLSGAHTSGENKNSIGIAYVGGMSKDMSEAKDTRTKEQKDSLVKLIQELIYTHNKDMQIFGHRNFSNKACPSFDARTEYAYL